MVLLPFWSLNTEAPQDSALGLFSSRIYCLRDLIQCPDFKNASDIHLISISELSSLNSFSHQPTCTSNGHVNLNLSRTEYIISLFLQSLFLMSPLNYWKLLSFWLLRSKFWCHSWLICFPPHTHISNPSAHSIDCTFNVYIEFNYLSLLVLVHVIIIS